MKEEIKHVPGLPAIQESRERRKRLPAIPSRFWIWSLTVLLAWGVFYWKQNQSEIESAKARLFARQRGVAAELSPKVDPLRDRIEQWVVEGAKPYEGDLVTQDGRDWDLGGVPGIYLRMRLADANDVKSIRKAADESLRDGFTSCFFPKPNPDPMTGPACRASRDCAAGTFCNEVDHCMVPAQPFNMRAIYRGIRVLTDDWTVRLRTASDDMKIRLLDREFETAEKDDIPLAIEVLTRAQFFMLVLDEGPEAKPVPRLEELQATPHPARVLLWGLKPGRDRLLVRLRRNVEARFVSAGDQASTDPAIVAAQQRQVNSCHLALQVRAALNP